MRRLIALLALVLATSCSGPSTDSEPVADGERAASATPDPATPGPSEDPAPDPAADQVVRILFFGNSHTRRHHVPGLVARLLRSGHPGLRVLTMRAPRSAHLDERAGDGVSAALVRSQAWDYVVLQGQNYSLSGARDYPVDGARELIELARSRGAVPILYAEWARRGVDESELIMATYERLAAVAPACIPPIPAAFDLALAEHPGLVLHAEDGNHSSAAGAQLASLVLVAGITGRVPPAIVGGPSSSGSSSSGSSSSGSSSSGAVPPTPRPWLVRAATRATRGLDRCR